MIRQIYLSGTRVVENVLNRMDKLHPFESRQLDDVYLFFWMAHQKQFAKGHFLNIPHLKFLNI